MTNQKENTHFIPKDHPRYKSLTYRHKIIEGMKDLIVAEAGLIAHGRGEAFDYIIGESTTENAKKAIEAAIAAFYLADHPVISVNGNVAALIPEELVKFSQVISAPLEINLFYRKEGRIEAIKKVLREAGAQNLLGVNESEMVEIEELSSNRRLVDPRGIKKADLVFVPLEDGDRTEALKKNGKQVITVDLNPISRTALWADITIVDNIIRAVPLMIETAQKFKNFPREKSKSIIANFDNVKNIQASLDLIISYIEEQKIEAFKGLDV
ncbi:MAG: phosphopantothenate/pantothenate synthetase [Candidatus Lokiarchaeota archaeon]|nr:phosphopantothenate/pantothenate synthetase [Candidatus Lokiarchaeota archaeon]